MIYQPPESVVTAVPLRLRRLADLVTMVATMVLLAACQAAPQTQPADVQPQVKVNNAGYSLLYSLVSKQQDVGKALWLRKVDPLFADVVKEIALTSGEARKQLDAFALKDSALLLKTQPLPKIEKDTRDAIESTDTRVLMTSTGRTFQLRLLLTQTNSMEYASHLAQVLARGESSDARKQFLMALSKKLDALNDKVIQLLAVKIAAK
jgi:hypothetical protein